MSDDNLDVPQPLSEQDQAIARELAEVRGQRQRFYDKLDGSLKALFSHCEWRITRQENGMTELVVFCLNMAVYKRLRNRWDTIHTRLQDSVEVKHTKFCLSCPQDPKAYYEHESKWENWLDGFSSEDEEF